MAKRPEEQLAEMIAGLKSKTGKDLDEWFELITVAGLTKHGQMMSFLKTDHGVSHGFANQIALRSVERQNPSPVVNDDPIEAMCAGTKAPIKPLFDLVLTSIKALGGDVDLAPKKGYVSVRRTKQFAIIQPSTASRVDVGINLKGVDPSGRLEASGSFNAMLSHRVRVSSLDEVDNELMGWLTQAYELA